MTERIVLLLTRDIKPVELVELQKWFTIYQYNETNIMNRSMQDLFSKYNIIALNITKLKDLEYWCARKIETKADTRVIFLGCAISEDILNQYGVNTRITKLPVDANSKEAYLTQLFAPKLPRVRQFNWLHKLSKLVKVIISAFQ